MSEGEEKKNSLEELRQKIKEMNSLSDPNKLHTVSLSELYDTVYKSKPAVIEDFIYPGLCILAGDSKIGKSLLVLQIGFHVATGTELWDKRVTEGTVLYLALEDQYARLQSRMYKMYGMESTDKLHFSVSAKSINDGLTEQLTDFVRKYPDTNLIIIDTLQKVRGVASEGYSYSKDYEFISALKSFSDRYGVCLLLVHHTKKEKDSDPFNNVNGTNGLMGSADTTMVLSKQSRTGLNAALHITGRDQPDTVIKISKNPETLIWNLDEFETQIYKEPPDPLLEKLSQKLTEYGYEWCGTATELASFLDVDMPPNKLSMKLNVSASKLLDTYSVEYSNTHTHDGRRIKLCRKEEASVTVGDDGDGKTDRGILS